MRRVIAATDLPSGMSTSLEGTFAAQEESMRTIGALGAVSLLLVFAILYSRYRSALFALVIIGQRAAGPHRRGGGPVAGRAAALGGEHDRLRDADRIAARNGILKISHTINLAITEGLPFVPRWWRAGALSG